MKLLILLVIFCLFIPVYATVIWVPWHFSTIQAGINAASNGDTVMVANGVYNSVGDSNLIFYGKSIHLKSQNGAEITFIDALNSQRCVNFINGEDSDTIIEGFTLRNGIGTTFAGGIHIEGASPTIKSNFIHNCIGEENGGGISIKNGNPVLIGNLLCNNQVPNEPQNREIGFGGGIAIIDNSSPILLYNIIINNYADIGGAIGISDQCNVLAVNNTICNNLCSILSGGIVIRNNSDLTLRNSILFGNIGSPNDQISILTSSTADVTYSDVEFGFADLGNINSDPEFILPSAGAGSTFSVWGTDWELEPFSPCIDQGDPNDSYDEDNTIRDMGIFYYHHEADFILDSSFGFVPHEIQFTNDSIGEATNWFWDFDSDGAWDSFDENPFYIFNEPGVYSVTLKITNFSWESVTTKENIIVIQENELLPPQNITIELIGTNVLLNWESVENANYYLIYVSNDPDGDYYFVDSTTGLTYETTDISIYEKLFFKIIGFDGEREELEEFIENNFILKY
ncbi:MAG: hypothetical protein K8S23_14020 [Candidatus Cloacimonetes bacterium]|nr:hypothetical protein [Candidatus Cloacimonadota bacterium]